MGIIKYWFINRIQVSEDVFKENILFESDQYELLLKNASDNKHDAVNAVLTNEDDVQVATFKSILEVKDIVKVIDDITKEMVDLTVLEVSLRPNIEGTHIQYIYTMGRLDGLEIDDTGAKTFEALSFLFLKDSTHNLNTTGVN